MHDVHQHIKELEKEIGRIKSEFSLGKISLDFSKSRIRQLEKELAHLVQRLPEHERELYMLRKEFGREF